MFSIECDKRTGNKKVTIQGDMVEVIAEVGQTIHEICKNNEVVASGVIIGAFYAMGEEFIIKCIKAAKESKVNAQKVKSDKEAEKAKENVNDLLKELERLIRGMADE